MLLLGMQAVALVVPIYMGDTPRRVAQFASFTAIGVAALWCVRVGRIRARGALLSIGVWGALTYIAATGFGS